MKKNVHLIGSPYICISRC